MKETYQKLNYEWLFKPTGDPFTDAGGYALEEFASHFPDSDILELIKKATDIYVDRWEAKINPFFLNSKITQPAFNGSQKKKETIKYYQELLENEGGKEGFCRITGQNTYVFPAGRDNSVLSGSRTFINFHHGFQEGLMFSKEIIIRYFFLPLACEQLQGRISLISSNRPVIAKYFCQMVCKKNLSDIACNSSKSIHKAKANSSGTALFRYADKIIMEFQREFDDGQGALSMYHFTNFGASPDLAIYQLPFQILRFYSLVQKVTYKDSWNDFVRQHYHLSGAKYNQQKNLYEQTVKKQLKEIEYEVYQYWFNTIYNNLLTGKSIIHDILNYYRKNEFNFQIVRIYAINIRHMKKETINKIEQMADFVIANNNDRGIEKLFVNWIV